MKKTLILIVSLFAVFAFAPAYAAPSSLDGPPTFSWTPPSDRVDGDAAANSEISLYQFFCSFDGAPVALQANVYNSPLGLDTVTFDYATFPEGLYDCFMTAVDTDGQSL